MYDWNFGKAEYLAIIVSIMMPEKIFKTEGIYDDFLDDYDEEKIHEIYELIKKNQSVNKIYELACIAIKEKKIVSDHHNYKNKKISPLTMVKPISFFKWAEKSGYQTRYSLKNALLKIEQDERIENFKKQKLTKTQLNLLLKEPLWKLPTGILYISGICSLGMPEDDERYVRENIDLNKIYQYAIDSHKINKLKLIRDTYPNSVEPVDLITWAESMDIKIPVTKNKLDTPENKIRNSLSYETPDMKLMRDAVTKFWQGYDLKKPDTSLAPFKKNVVDWLIKEAASRNMEGFSKSRAEAMDTIIRCPKARQGGNTR